VAQQQAAIAEWPRLLGAALSDSKPRT
jgi:hypothetical protein